MPVTKVLVRLGVYSRVVSFGDGKGDLESAIRFSFSDVYTNLADAKLHIQVKVEEWGGEFIDLQEGQTISNHDILNVVIVPQVCIHHSLIVACFFNMYFYSNKGYSSHYDIQTCE